MAERLQPVRGTHDVLGEESAKRRALIERAFAVARTYGYEEMSVPIFEFTEVFQRTLGETSDVVSKEMYTFQDRGGESLTLRPEFTAGICRAILSGGLQQNLPMKVFAYGPVFRYERPQKGRMRQFHQLDCEFIGVADPIADIEVLSLGDRILKALGLEGKVSLEINSLGDKESREAYRAALIEYFSRFKDDLSEDSQRRLLTNPLRILDSKDAGDRTLIADAPRLADFYSVAAQGFFERVQEGLAALDIAYTVNETLVRGLDYYCHTAFEFTTTLLGSQNAVLAGGRYDGLMEQMGGPLTPAIGFAGGIERLQELFEYAATTEMPIFVLPVTDGEFADALKLADRLRQRGHVVELATGGALGKRLKKADKAGARFAVLLGGDELKQGAVTLRDLKDGQQENVTLDRVSQWLEEKAA